MPMRRRHRQHRPSLLLAVLLTILPLTAEAQTVGWRLPPAGYSSIVRFGHDLYKVEQAGKVGLIHSDGTVVVPVEATAIGNFYENRALVTRDEGSDRHRILGVMTSQGRYTAFTDAYYTLSGQEFFSEGLLSVTDANGKKGYIDEDGKKRCGFNRDYNRIKPFTEGYAAVRENGAMKYYLIDRQGVPLTIVLTEEQIGRTVANVYNPVQGKVLYYDDYGKCCKFDLESRKSERVKQLDGQKNMPSTDYLFRPQTVLKSVGMPVLTAAPLSTLPPGEAGLEPLNQNGKYGFAANGKTVLPCQLDSATPFEDGLSIVSMGGRWGILTYYGGEQHFELTTPQAQLDFDGGSSVDCQFALKVPQAWSDKPVSITLTDRDSHDTLIPTGNNGLFAFQLTPEHSVQKAYEVSVASEGLQLWTSELTYTLRKKAVGLYISQLTLESKVADHHYKVPGSFVVYNPNEGEVTADISFKHNNLSREINDYPHTITLKSGERRRVTFSLVTINRRGQWKHAIEVSTSEGGHASLTAEVETF